MRRLSPSRQKNRGIPRQLRALKKWSDSFNNCFLDPEYFDDNRKYCNWKIPVRESLVMGKQAKQSIQAECAQRLIDACDSLMKAKPEWAINSRVTTRVVLPDMFASEVCIYFQEEYFQSHISPTEENDRLEYYEQKRIADRSLSQEWGLLLPKNIFELGISKKYVYKKDLGDSWTAENWFFGEIN